MPGRRSTTCLPRALLSSKRRSGVFAGEAAVRGAQQAAGGEGVDGGEPARAGPGLVEPGASSRGGGHGRRLARRGRGARVGAGQGLEKQGGKAGEAEEREKEARWRAAGLPVPRMRQEEADAFFPRQALEVEFVMTTNSPKAEVTIDLPLGDVRYAFRVEAITCVGKGPRSDKVVYKADLEYDEKSEMPRQLAQWVVQKRLAAEILPVTGIRLSGEARKAELKGSQVLSEFEKFRQIDDDLSQFATIWRLLVEGGLKLSIGEEAEQQDDKKDKRNMRGGRFCNKQTVGKDWNIRRD
ncbi:unnamed protein product [Prorocentrum cordatum]|uniref:Uncharacterized protein n=1 Tax=Prorocentrum cordatum TaxID=2364126 RepID=A0ABN9WFG9_9DINO|nr:unnamed protein product [Polarella glacialis]